MRTEKKGDSNQPSAESIHSAFFFRLILISLFPEAKQLAFSTVETGRS